MVLYSPWRNRSIAWGLFGPSLQLDMLWAGVPFTNFRWLANFGAFLSRNDLTTVVHALVTFRLDYCNVLYMVKTWKVLRSFNWCTLLQKECWPNWVVGIVSLQSWSTYTSLWPLSGHIRMLKLTLYGLESTYVKDHLLPYEPDWLPQSSFETVL